MNPPPQLRNQSPPAIRLSALAAAGLLAVAALLVYANSFAGPFVFDDIYSIPLNGTIRHLATALSPPGSGITVSGRPLLNFSFALNYAISGMDVWSYHALNLLIHLLAGLTLFGIVRRTLRLRSGQALAAPLQMDALALAVALLWTVHPLQTESVTYVVQRSESMMGLFYLLTLYCFIRGAAAETLETPRKASGHREPGTAGRGDPAPLSGNPHALLRRFAPRNDPLTDASTPWFVASILACLAGMATKEVMVSAPVLVLLYDRTFLAGSFREAWRQRGRWYLGLAATWLLLAWLVVGAANRGGTAGFGVGVGFWQYAATQFEAVARYLWLSIWPHPLIVDYGVRWVTAVPDVVPYAAVVAAVVAGTAVALWRRPVLGFLGAWFLALLAPTSLVPGTRQTIVEHRMYLALAPVIVLLVLGLQRTRLRQRGWVLLLAVAVGWGGITAQRNRAYRSDLALWGDTAARRPGNNAAHVNLGSALLELGRAGDALAQFREALRLKPDDADAYYNAANALVRLGRLDEAIGHFQAALQLRPSYFDAHNNLAETLLRAGRIPDAVKQYEAAVRLKPDLPGAHYNLGSALARAGRLPEAVGQLETALRLQPDYSEAHNNLGNLCLRSAQIAEAMKHYAAAIRANPANPEAHFNLGGALMQLGRLAEAEAQYDAVLRLQPDSVEAAYNLGTILFDLGRMDEARAQFERVLRRQPDNVAAHNNLGTVLGRSGRFQEAIGHYQAALRAGPPNVVVRYNLGAALLELGRLQEAKDQFEAVLRLQSDFEPARRDLARVEALQAAGR